MILTSNYGLKKPEGEDLVDLQDFNDNADAVDAKLKDIEGTCQTNTGDTSNNLVTFTTADEESPTAWTEVDVIKSGEKHSSLFNKISTMFKNVRWLYKMLGTTDISAIGGGTVTGAIVSQNEAFTKEIADLNTDLGNLTVTDVSIDSNNGGSQYVKLWETGEAGYIDFRANDSSLFRLEITNSGMSAYYLIDGTVIKGHTLFTW